MLLHITLLASSAFFGEVHSHQVKLSIMQWAAVVLLSACLSLDVSDSLGAATDVQQLVFAA